ncbi:haloacid dehalogenase superfamily, subfamily IA, variant 3 with third motif having DD or ED [Desulfocicer vacuolatum DSM 3385]|uniref:phosphoglycolate phosphatase n=1 Tax=Desulfocicer vacuolatum DSM 3385 TaxID=1121400 RepID=A0A1W2C2U7_9BACT|nr:HAD hydrolase-like protein [Desulfocicer vacuolatum]SMC79222.1 haloacid dehalogenase superfamily, subfamily IA, variant 3 with third motif having DD or ED [Desulfocicer vacuolatum DSM 3385]
MNLNMESIKAVVFDCDGVMFDTSGANEMYYNMVLSHFGKPELTREQFVKVHMFTVQEALEYLFPELESLTPVYDFMGTMGYDQFIPHMAREKGLKKLLAALKEKGLIRAVATNRTNTMQAVLNAHELEDAFDMVVTAADVEHPKPSPEQLHAIMKRYSLVPGQMLFVGDSSYDQMAAGTAGVPFIAFKNKALEADFHVTSMARIGEIVGIKQ